MPRWPICLPRGQSVALAGLTQQHAVIEGILRDAVSSGELARDADIAALAWYYLGILQAVLDLPQAGATPVGLRCIVDIAMSNWPTAAPPVGAPFEERGRTPDEGVAMMLALCSLGPATFEPVYSSRDRGMKMVAMPISAENSRDRPFVRIQSSATPPGNTYTAVRYRKTWYWIDDHDLASKRVFSFLMIFFSLAETGVTPQAPVLTLPAN